MLIMQAVILAGGKGTRLRPYTMTIPKPLLPLGDMPILEVVLRQLASAGISRVIVTLGHLAHLFTALIGNGAKFGLKIDYCMEREPLGTAGPLRLIDHLDEHFLVMNGDVLTTLDYKDLFNTHINENAWSTIAICRREVDIDYGVIEIREDGSLDKYDEKPTIPYYVSMGINILSRKCVKYIPESGKFDMPQLMMAMRNAGQKVICYRTDCYWQDIGRFDDYQQASEDFLNDPQRFISQLRTA
jgi:NDP-sugar pyrophosphorylase family protein